MKKSIVKVVAIASFLFIACQSSPKTDNKDEINNTEVLKAQDISKTTDISFVLAKNYFVKDTIDKLDNPKIDTAEKFNEIFGMATTMGRDGKPTEIDFNKQYVIAVVLPETDLMTTIDPVSLQKDGNGKITLTYKKVVGQKQTYTIKPSFEIIVDKTENGTIELKEQK